MFQNYHPSRVLTLVYQPFAVGTIAILAYHEATLNTRKRNLIGFTLFFFSSLAIVIVSMEPVYSVHYLIFFPSVILAIAMSFVYNLGHHNFLCSWMWQHLGEEALESLLVYASSVEYLASQMVMCKGGWLVICI